MLHVSFWRISLWNFPGGAFRRRSLSDGDAAALVTEARGDGSLVGVSRDDLGAPFERASYERHVHVCEALRARGVQLQIEDFFCDRCCNALEIARVSRGSRLLVVDVGFEVDPSATPPAARTCLPGGLFKVSALRLQFHLFEEITT
jgi:hypothetical protein